MVDLNRIPGALTAQTVHRLLIPPNSAARNIVIHRPIKTFDGPGPALYAMPPRDLRLAATVGECSGHISNPVIVLACPPALERGQPPLIWDWNIFPCIDGKTCPPTYDGFNVYRTGAASDTLIGSTDGGLTVRGRFLSTWTPGSCYYVTSRSGALESDPSNLFCIGSGVGSAIRRTTLSAQTVQHFTVAAMGGSDDWYCPTKYGGLGTDSPTPDYTALVGFGHHFDPGTQPLACVDWSVSADRTAVYFDLSSLKGRWINRATLRYATTDPVNCATRLIIANDHWRDRPLDGVYLPGGAIYSAPSTATGEVSEPVTEAVRAWVIDGGNEGFVLANKYDDLRSRDNGSCHTTFLPTSFKLVVETLPGS